MSKLRQAANPGVGADANARRNVRAEEENPHGYRISLQRELRAKANPYTVAAVVSPIPWDASAEQALLPSSLVPALTIAARTLRRHRFASA